jgi:hypothetical protein
MSPRLRRTLLGSLPYLAVLLLAALTVPTGDRRAWLLLWVPLCAVVSLGMDWFVWNRPSRMRDRELRKQQNAQRSLRFARRATCGEIDPR